MGPVQRVFTDEEGFTLVELLVVVMCIGILAAMAIPSFLNQRSKAQDGAAKSDARTSLTAAETLYLGDQTYATLSPAKLRSIESALNNANITAATGTATTYTVTVTSASNNTFSVNRAANGLLTRTCSPAGSGACANNGSW
jgi:type IV pilus assembly protein PilA